jgi:hypothetical protein
MQGKFILFAFFVDHNCSQDYGVKANLKSEALIDLLLETQYAMTSSRSLLIHKFLQIPAYSSADQKICLNEAVKPSGSEPSNINDSP